MQAPYRDTQSAYLTQYALVIKWTALIAPDNGDSVVTSYHLRWFNTGSWLDLYGVNPDAVLTEFIVTSNIKRGTTYPFEVRAGNIHGYGPWSDYSYIKAAGIPY